jgi:hypothetical protein
MYFKTESKGPPRSPPTRRHPQGEWQVARYMVLVRRGARLLPTWYFSPWEMLKSDLSIIIIICRYLFLSTLHMRVFDYLPLVNTTRPGDV